MKISPFRLLKTSRFTPYWILFWLGVLGATLSLGGRWKREMKPSPVQIMVEWDDAARCASAWGVSTDQLLRDLRARGVRGVVCEPATVANLVNEGRISLLSRTAAQATFPELERAPRAYSFVIWSRDARLFSQIESWLRPQSRAVKPLILTPRRDGMGRAPLRAMALGLSPRALVQWPLGFDGAQISTVRGAGLEPVARLSNPENTSPALIEKIIAEAQRTGARLWMAEGEIPGFRTLLPFAGEAMRRHHLALIFEESATAQGTGDIARDAQGWIVRGHSIGASDTARLERGELLDRYARAARERNVRALILRLPRALKGDGREVSSRDQSLQFVADLRREISADPLPWRGLRPRLQVGLARPVGAYPTSNVKAIGARFLAALGVLGAVLLLLNLAADFSLRKQRILALAGALIGLALAVSPSWGAKLIALAGALVFPLVALFWCGLSSETASLSRRAAFQSALAMLARATGLSLAGGILIAAALNDWTFHVKIAEFWGTKAASLMPVALAGAGMAGGFWPRQVETQGAGAAWQRLKTRLAAGAEKPFPLRSILLGALSLAIVALWLARSGNESGVAVSSLEWKFRATLESLFIARPRTKEFLLCHPAFLLGVFAWLARRKPLGFALLMLGVIGQISVVNSFAQANNPLYIPLWRTVLSLLLSALAGSLLLWFAAPRFGFERDATSWRGWKTVRRLSFAAIIVGLMWSWNFAAQRRRLYAQLTAPVPQASWPWRGARHEILAPGVEHWFDESSPDGTTLDLLSFDFAANSRLRFEMFDSDLATSGKKSPANRFAYWNNGLGSVAARLNRRGDLVAAWNGGFWGLLNRKPRENDRAFHLSPIVSEGQVFYPGLNRRWTWGAKIVAGRPIFSLQHAPDNATLVRDFDFGGGTLQALLKDGAPLQLRPYLWFGETPPKPPLPSTALEAGAIPVLDHMHTSRVGAGWTKAGRLFVLVVKEPDGEAPSRAAVGARKRGSGGWTLHDHQKFWLAMRDAFEVQNAVGLDGGDVAQAVFRRPDGDFTLLVPRVTLPASQSATLRLQARPDFKSPDVKKLHGGALNYFLVRQVAN